MWYIIVIAYYSDGSGRSGTFCAIMTLIQCVQIENIVDVFQTVRQLREERIGMVDSMVRMTIIIISLFSYSLSLISKNKTNLT